MIDLVTLQDLICFWSVSLLHETVNDEDCGHRIHQNKKNQTSDWDRPWPFGHSNLNISLSRQGRSFEERIQTVLGCHITPLWLWQDRDLLEPVMIAIQSWSYGFRNLVDIPRLDWNGELTEPSHLMFQWTTSIQLGQVLITTVKFA